MADLPNCQCYYCKRRKADIQTYKSYPLIHEKQLVWFHVKGMTIWPATIVDPHTLKAQMEIKLAKTHLCTVLFFDGTATPQHNHVNVNFANKKHLYYYKSNYEKFRKGSQLSKFLNAVQEAEEYWKSNEDVQMLEPADMRMVYPLSSPKRMIHKSEMENELNPPPSVSQSQDIRKVLPAKPHSSTSSTIAIDEEDGQSVSICSHNDSTELSRSEPQVKMLEDMVKLLKKNNSTLCAQNSKLVSSIEKLESEDKKQIHEVKTKLEAAITELKTRNEASETMCQQYKTQVQQKTLEADSAIEQKEFLMKQNETLRTKCEQLNLSLKEKEKAQAEQLQNEVAKLNAELEKKDKELENCMQKVVVSDSKVIGLETMKTSLENEMESLKRRIENEKEIEWAVDEELEPSRPKRSCKEKHDVYWPPLHLMDDIKRENTCQTICDQQMSNLDENPQQQSTNLDQVASSHIKEELSNDSLDLEADFMIEKMEI